MNSQKIASRGKGDQIEFQTKHCICIIRGYSSFWRLGDL